MAPAAEGTYPRLSPFDERGVQIVEDLYIDLAASSHFSGLLFHDDAALSGDEDASETAVQFYHRDWGLPADLESILAHHSADFTRLKTDHLIRLTGRLSEAVRRFRPAIKTSRNLFAPAVLNPESEAWFAQNFEKFLAAYDYTALMAMPFLEGVNRANPWLERLVVRVAAHPNGIAKTLFELQTIDWRTGRRLSKKELAAQLDTLLYRGARHIAYYPEDFATDHPDLAMLRSRLSVNTYAALQE
jgi:biofilm PGA synthesis lipoprotein PgaB